MSNTQARRFSKRLRDRLESGYQPLSVLIPAVLGNQAGTVQHPTYPDYLYVSTHEGQVLSVFNGGVSPDSQAGTPVILLKDPVNRRLTVYGYEDVYSSAPVGSFAHGSAHQWPDGLDVVWVRGEQLLPNLGTVVEGMTVRLMGGIYHTGSSWQSYPTQDIDMTTYIPASGARFALLQIAPDKTVDVKLGTSRGGKSALTAGDIPEPDPGNCPICAVLLYAGQTMIVNDGTGNADMVDLRWGKYSMTVNPSSDALSQLNAGDIAYTVGTPADWDYYPSEPNYVSEALDEAIKRVAALEDVPPPNASLIPYTPRISADWDYYLNEPDYVANALDELADRLAMMELGSIETFLALTDTPSSYSGSAGQAVVVNGSADGLTFSATTGEGIPLSGWIPYSAVTPTRSSADDPTYVLSFAGVDLTGTISVGMKIKWTQNSTVRYGIVTAISFSTNTTLTLYGGTDYNVEDTSTYPISAFNYSPVRAPLSFPLEKELWQVELIDTTGGSQSNPTANTWYNVTSITIPIGNWKVYYAAHIEAKKTTAEVLGKATLSTANNSQSDSEMTRGVSGYAVIGAQLHMEKDLTLSAKDVYYLNMATLSTGASVLALRGTGSPTFGGPIVIRAICNYL